MIGINVRGMHHLWRLCDNGLNRIMANCGDYGAEICDVIKTDFDGTDAERMFIFNPFITQSRHLENAFQLIDKYGIKVRKVVEVDKISLGDSINGFFSNIIFLPKTFDSDYETFLKENAKLIQRLREKYGFSTNETYIKELYLYTNGSKNFFEWGIDLIHKDICSRRVIKSILVWNDSYSHLAKKLSRGTITAYRTNDAIRQLREELINIRNDKRINDSINSFNTAQKKLLKSNELSEKDKKALIMFSKMSDVKKTNFIQKVSTIDDFQEIMRLLKLTTSIHFEWDKKSFMDYINNVENINYNIILDTDKIVLLKVSDYETVKQLGKTTNWCISKNKKYWNNYIETTNGNCEQYMLFDFSKIEDDKFSIIGFTTTKNKGITSAHNFTNDNILESPRSTTVKLKSFLSNIKNNDNIFDILEFCGVDITSVVRYDKPLYEWSHDGMLQYLYECVDKNDVTILKDEDNKLVFTVCNQDINYFLGDKYASDFSTDHYSLKHIVFADFSKSQYDPNKMMFSVIYQGKEEQFGEIFNSVPSHVEVDCDQLLNDYDLPFDIIKRVNNKTRKIQKAFYSYDMKTLKCEISKDKNSVHDVMKTHIHSDTILDTLLSSLVEENSFEYFDLIYENGHKISDYLSERKVDSLFINIFNHLRHVSQNSFLMKPSESEVDELFKQHLTDADHARYVAFYVVLKKILKNEGEYLLRDHSMFMTNLFSLISTFSSSNDTMIMEFLNILLEKMDLKKETYNGKMLIRCLMRFNDPSVQKTLNELKETYKWIKIDNVTIDTEYAQTIAYSSLGTPIFE